MSDLKHPSSARRMSDLLESRERRRQAADRRRERDPHGQEFWRGFITFGRVGWSVAVPTLIGAGLGAWIDSLAAAPGSWVLVCLLAGLGLGCINACRWLETEHRRLLDSGEHDRRHDGHETSDSDHAGVPGTDKTGRAHDETTSETPKTRRGNPESDDHTLPGGIHATDNTGHAANRSPDQEKPR